VSIPIIPAAQLRELIGWEDLIEPVSAAFRESSDGLADNGLIVMYPGRHREEGDVYVKTGVLHGHGVFIVKVAPWFAVNAERGESQGGFTSVFDAPTGHALAILSDQHYLSDIRTAAPGAVAARTLCPRGVERATVVGAGVQAFWQAIALHRVRPYRQLTVWARDSTKCRVFADRLQRQLPDVVVQTSLDLGAAIRACDVLITATIARDPLIRGEWLHEGQHITAVGADDPFKCELAVDALERAKVFVDSLSASARNGDIFRAIRDSSYSTDKVCGEIGEIVAGRKPGRTASSDITIAKLVGLGAQDLVAAETVLQKIGLTTERARAGIT
jgi:ornithine cyclodeaminase